MEDSRLDVQIHGPVIVTGLPQRQRSERSPERTTYKFLHNKNNESFEINYWQKFDLEITYPFWTNV